MDRRARPRRKAIAAVELALLLPLLTGFLLGIWEVGRYIDATIVLQGAAREGARQAAAGSRIDPTTGVLTGVYATQPTSGGNVPDVQSIVTNYLAAEGCNTANVTVTYQNLDPTPSANGYPDKSDPYEANRLDHLRVTVTIPYKDIRWSPTQMFIDYNATVSATVDWNSMRDDAFSVNSTIPNN
jgi:Flp pilus assembly protein TadG